MKYEGTFMGYDWFTSKTCPKDTIIFHTQMVDTEIGEISDKFTFVRIVERTKWVKKSHTESL